jgi:hypothetical protein
MKDLSKGILIACLLIAFSYPVVGEVSKLNFGTDTSWKCLNFEQSGWTSEDYDDSWWESAVDSGKEPNKLDGRLIWYPGKVTEDMVYFRGTFEIPGADIIYGTLDAGLRDGGAIELYLNDNPIGTVKTSNADPTRIDVAPYIKPGKNVIAAKVTIPSSNIHAWGLSGIIRYNM